VPVERHLRNGLGVHHVRVGLAERVPTSV
jgi:hypothetical protein